MSKIKKYIYIRHGEDVDLEMLSNKDLDNLASMLDFEKETKYGR